MKIRVMLGVIIVVVLLACQSPNHGHGPRPRPSRTPGTGGGPMKLCQCGTALTRRDRLPIPFRSAYCKGCRFRMSIGMPPRSAPQPRSVTHPARVRPHPDGVQPDPRDPLSMIPAMVVIQHSCTLPTPLVVPSRWSCPECGIWWSCVPREGGARWMKEATPVPASVLASQGATWDAKQRAAAPGFFYGDGGTIHGTTHLDVEVDVDGVVVAVWYRCRQLPFVQVLVNNQRAEEMRGVREEGALPKLTGVHLLDP